MAGDPDPNLGSTTELVRVLPTVVRRRVYDVGQMRQANAASPTVPIGYVPDEDDSSGPPSWGNVARALASLRGEELERMEELLRQDDEAEAARVTAAAEAKAV